jgi:hypothetical protein
LGFLHREELLVKKSIFRPKTPLPVSGFNGRGAAISEVKMTCGGELPSGLGLVLRILQIDSLWMLAREQAISRAGCWRTARESCRLIYQRRSMLLLGDSAITGNGSEFKVISQRCQSNQGKWT